MYNTSTTGGVLGLSTGAGSSVLLATTGAPIFNIIVYSLLAIFSVLLVYFWISSFKTNFN